MSEDVLLGVVRQGRALGAGLVGDLAPLGFGAVSMVLRRQWR